MERLKGALAILLGLQLGLPSPAAFAQAAPAHTAQPGGQSARQPYQSGELQGDDRILQALNRFTFGARPGDLEAVRAMGLEKWFAQQLNPQSLNQADLEARLAQFPAMQWSTTDLLVRLPSNAVIRQAADGKIAVPPTGALHAVYENEIARYENRQQQKAEKKQQATVAPNAAMATVSMNTPPNGQGAGMTTESRQPNTTPPGRDRSTGMTRPADERPEPPAPTQAQIDQIIAEIHRRPLSASPAWPTCSRPSSTVSAKPLRVLSGRRLTRT